MMDSDSLKYRQAERDDGNRDRDDRGRFFSAVQRKCAEEKSDEEAAGIAQENCGGIEVVAKKSEDGARQCDRHQLHKRLAIE